MKIAYQARCLLLLSTLCLSTACGGPQTSAPAQDRCGDVGAPASQIWNQSLKHELNFPQKIYAGNLAAGEAEFLVRNLDKFVEDWQGERHQACIEAEAMRVQGRPFVRSSKEECLERVLVKFSALIDEIRASKDLEYARITDIFGELSSCAGRAIPPALELKLSPFEDDTDYSNDTDGDFWND